MINSRSRRRVGLERESAVAIGGLCCVKLSMFSALFQVIIAVNIVAIHHNHVNYLFFSVYHSFWPILFLSTRERNSVT